MKIADYIKGLFGVRDNHVLTYNRGGYMPNWEISKHKFGETIYLNIVELMTSIYSEVVWSSPLETPKYKAWRKYVEQNGQRILTQLLFFKNGFCVIGYDSELNNGVETWRFYELPDTKWTIVSDVNGLRVQCHNPAQRYYVLKSPTMEAIGVSERTLCDGDIKLIDAVMNGACTTAERLGAYVVMTPASDNFGGELLEAEKDELEKQLQKEYGMLSKQKQIMVLPRPMNSQVVSLAAVDAKMNDKLRAAVLAIADRIKVPANQIALIDANSSKALSNGSELREGDTAKYRAFRRLLNATFYDMATELGLRVDYSIENEPQTIQGQQIEQGNEQV